LHFIPVAGTLAVVGISGAMNYLYTWRLGAAMATMFDKPDFSFREALAIAAQLVKVLIPKPSSRELIEIFGTFRGTSS
jgi:hypothetical protein